MNSEETYKHPLITYLLDHSQDRAMLAALRRGLGQLPGDAPEMLPYVVPFSSKSRWTERVAFLVASLYALHPEHISRGNMGAHVRQIDPQGDNSDAIERRFTALMRIEPDDLDAPLRQMVSLLKSKDIAINWHELMSDLLAWNDPEKRRKVTLRWANAFWNPKQS